MCSLQTRKKARASTDTTNAAPHAPNSDFCAGGDSENDFTDQDEDVDL